LIAASLALGARIALAAGASADIELLRPGFSPGDLPVADTPVVTRAGTVRAGMLFQYEKEPLVLYRFGQPVGAVIESRDTWHLGVSLALGSMVSARIALPVSYEWASEVPELASQGLGAGDLSAGARVRLLALGPFQLAARADAIVPTGAKGAWLGEEGVRGVPGLLLRAGDGPVDGLLDLSAILRSEVDTGQDFVHGTTLDTRAALRVQLWPGRLASWVGAVSRAGTRALFVDGTAENLVELAAGTQVALPRDLALDLGIGKGISEGAGSSQFRAMLGLSWTRTPRPESRPVLAAIDTRPEYVPDALIISPLPEAEPEWEPEELARVVEDQIVIRDPIQFEFAKDVILPISFPTLEQVSQVMASHPEIGHVVIEGHASEEGSFAYNYNLSNLRANAIFRALAERGVHPRRLSCRSQGEVEPIDLGTDEAALERNRRVIFHIVRRYVHPEVLPAYPPRVRLPWTGDEAAMKALPPLPVPAGASDAAPISPEQRPPSTPDDTPAPSEFDQEEEP
jgi:outer membrane protein OmpA-like peptidoglycan-associated protein